MFLKKIYKETLKRCLMSIQAESKIHSLHEVFVLIEDVDKHLEEIDKNIDEIAKKLLSNTNIETDNPLDYWISEALLTAESAIATLTSNTSKIEKCFLKTVKFSIKDLENKMENIHNKTSFLRNIPHIILTLENLKTNLNDACEKETEQKFWEENLKILTDLISSYPKIPSYLMQEITFYYEKINKTIQLEKFIKKNKTLMNLLQMRNSLISFNHPITDEILQKLKSQFKLCKKSTRTFIYLKIAESYGFNGIFKRRFGKDIFGMN